MEECEPDDNTDVLSLSLYSEWHDSTASGTDLEEADIIVLDEVGFSGEATEAACSPSRALVSVNERDHVDKSAGQQEVSQLCSGQEVEDENR